MRSKELGEFLRSRRGRLRPGDVGFPDTDRRRTAGLRREELCAMAGVAVSWLARLEQGRAHSVSPDVLEALSNALRLDDTERRYLFALAGFRADRRQLLRPEVTPALRVLLDGLDPNPAYLLDRAWNVVAWNDAEANLFPGLLDYADAPPNLLRLVFLNHDLRRLMVDHAEEAVRLVAQFRAFAIEWAGDPEVALVISQLEAESPVFAGLWRAEDVRPFVTNRRVFDHALAGRLVFDHHRFAALDQLGTQLVVYTSPPGSDSALRLRAVSGRNPGVSPQGAGEVLS